MKQASLRKTLIYNIISCFDFVRMEPESYFKNT